MSGETILVVDDAVFNLKLIATVLRNSGYKVQLASTAEQALSSLNTLRPDLVLADIQLPGMDGLELTRRIRQQARLRDVVVIAKDGVGPRGLSRRRSTPAATASSPSRYLVPKVIGGANPSLSGGRAGRALADQDELRSVLGRFSLSGPETETLRREFLEEALRQSH